MDPVDVLTVAVVAAQAIRSSSDPEAVIRGAYATIGHNPPGDRDEAMAIRIARLMTTSEERRNEVLAFLREDAGPIAIAA